MGYLRGIVHGAVIGTAVGVCIAPQEGSVTRRQLQGAWAGAQDAVTQLRACIPQVRDAAQRVTPQAQKAAGAVGDMVGGMLVKANVRRDRDDAADNGEIGMALNGTPVPERTFS